jgi:hypothetical protein
MMVVFLSMVIIYSHTSYIPEPAKVIRSYQNLYIEEEQTTQWPKEKVQKDKQRSTKPTHKIGTMIISIVQ